MSKINTSPPLSPPFPVGTRLRCVDPQPWRKITLEVNGKEVVIYAPGLEVVIDETRPGRQGTGRLVDEIDGEEIYDETRDGYSVYHVDGASDYGRCIHRTDVANWEVIKEAK
jgi:hypothetical protein